MGAVHLDVVRRIDRRHPDFLSTEAQRHFSGGGVNAAHELVQHDPAENLESRKFFLNQIGPAHRAFVMALEHDGIHPGVGRRLSCLAVIHPALKHAGIRMHMKIDRSIELDERHPVHPAVG